MNMEISFVRSQSALMSFLGSPGDAGLLVVSAGSEGDAGLLVVPAGEAGQGAALAPGWDRWAEVD